MDKVIRQQAEGELERMKLERLGRRIIEGRIYERRRRAFDRRILQCVHDHIHASAGELKDRLDELFAERGTSIGPDAEEMQAEIEKVRL